MNKAIFEKLKKLKSKYKEDGFIIVGISGSYARGEETPKSDLDIVYEIDYDTYTKKHNGFEAFSYLNTLREKLKNEFNKEMTYSILKKTIEQLPVAMRTNPDKIKNVLGKKLRKPVKADDLMFLEDLL